MGEDEEVQLQSNDEDLKNDNPPVAANPSSTTTGFKPLPMTDASDSWMDEDMRLSLEDEDEDDVVAEQVHEEEEVKVKEVEKLTIPSNPPTISTGFKPLPMTDASDSWMDDDVGMSLEDGDDEDEEAEGEVEALEQQS